MDNVNGKKMKIFAVDAENLQHLMEGVIVPLGNDEKIGIICDTDYMTSAKILKAVTVGISLREKGMKDREEKAKSLFKLFTECDQPRKEK